MTWAHTWADSSWLHNLNQDACLTFSSVKWADGNVHSRDHKRQKCSMSHMLGQAWHRAALLLGACAASIPNVILAMPPFTNVYPFFFVRSSFIHSFIASQDFSVPVLGLRTDFRLDREVFGIGSTARLGLFSPRGVLGSPSLCDVRQAAQPFCVGFRHSACLV